MNAVDPAAKAEIIRRIRSALEPAAPSVDVPRAYQTSQPTDVDLLDRFVERVEDYRATVARTTVGNLPAAVAEALGDAGRIVVPDDLDEGWLPEARTRLRDDPATPLSVQALDGVDAVVTAAAVGIAETGTIVLDGGAGQGRRAVTLVPDLHVVVIRADQIVGTVPEAVRLLDPRSPQTWISGPSATSDIELDRVEGVHGPRTLHVVLVQT